MRICITIFFIVLCCSVSAQDTVKPRGGKLGSRLKSMYGKLDSSRATHKYIQQINEFSKDVKGRYKKADSMARNDSGGVGLVYHTVSVARKAVIAKRNNSVATSREKQQSHSDAPPVVIARASAKNETATNPYLDKGDYYLKANNPGEAVRYYEKGLAEAKETHNPSVQQTALKGLSDAYDQKKDVKNALFYFKQYTAIKDSLLQVQTEKQISELQARYELAKQQGEIETLTIDGEKKGDEIQKSNVFIRKQQQYLLLIGISLVLAIVLAITLFRQYRTKKKVNEQLLVQNNKIEEQKHNLEENLAYTHQLQEALKEDLDRYMQMALRKQMNPHFIFNSLNSIQSFILQNDKLSANIYLSKFAGLMRKVLENSQHEYVTVEEEIEVLKLYVELEQQRFDDSFTCIWKLPEDEETMDSRIPPLILQPYVENAIWHGLLHKSADRALTIEVRKEQELLVCIIADNGIGRAAAAEFRKHREKGKSLGTRITQKRIDILNSLNNSDIGVTYTDLSNDDGTPCGTSVAVSIPVNEMI
ncbi:hypothetical protein CJD36_009835 [Flavipsychrobacter stenotrophus]|uniref:Signal transduction histidine kinase internal region domain-containing protein n=1 Tax=Flavipsychrobacter stenotrophus TaxID=2077091 RepID=A0A2S7SYR4_9BACT|nr:histidine kinase [Flavipsychrobacter stenotrophus]PQJ12079.1 hypothetical protein CJD36_009835 [Flavipsychrobacter stenotrophus]